jgi:NADP-dependent 3-hydroxy acid dehydrogenase YdfG
MASLPEPFPLTGRNVLVTGASRGIGLAVARALKEAGAWVGMVARSERALAEAAQAIGGVPLVADVSDAAAVEKLSARVREALAEDAPDVVVNVAGAFELSKLAETSLESFDRQLAVNLRAPFLLLRAFLPAMLARRSGDVITVGSIAGRVAFPANGAYAASKFGVRGLHAVLDTELRGTGVRSTYIEPAATDTPLWDTVDRANNPTLPTRDAMLNPDAVADAVLFVITRPRDVDVRTIILERA